MTNAAGIGLERGLLITDPDLQRIGLYRLGQRRSMPLIWSLIYRRPSCGSGTDKAAANVLEFNAGELLRRGDKRQLPRWQSEEEAGLAIWVQINCFRLFPGLENQQSEHEMNEMVTAPARSSKPQLKYMPITTFILILLLIQECCGIWEKTGNTLV